MRRIACLTLPLLLLFFTGCADQPTAPEVDLTASFAKGGKPGKPGGGGDPTPVDPTFLFSDGAGNKLGFSLFFMDMDGNRARALSDSDENGIESVSAIWSPDGTQFVYNREVVIRRAPNEFQIMIGSLNDASGDWAVEELPVSGSFTGHPEPLVWSPEGWILLDADGDLWTVKPNGDDLTQLTHDGDLGSASWSTDGGRILAHVWSPGGFWGLRLYYVECGTGVCVQTGESKEIPRAYFEAQVGLLYAVYPGDWGNTEENGDKVLCSISLNMNGTTSWDLGLLDLSDPDAPILANLTNSPGSGESQPAWSPTDAQIVHTRWTFDHAPQQLVIREYPTGTFRPLADASIHFGVDWRPGGS